MGNAPPMVVIRLTNDTGSAVNMCTYNEKDSVYLVAKQCYLIAAHGSFDIQAVGSDHIYVKKDGKGDFFKLTNHGSATPYTYDGTTYKWDDEPAVSCEFDEVSHSMKCKGRMDRPQCPVPGPNVYMPPGCIDKTKKELMIILL